MERLFFTVLVAYDVSGTATAMIGWLALKLATNWNYAGQQTERTFAFSALLAGLFSMLVAMACGLAVRGR